MNKSMIEKAIKDMKCIQFMYEGFPRIVEPHCYGVTAKRNHVIRGYQIGGSSLSGNLGWRLFDLEKIHDLIILDEYFLSPRIDYKKGDKNMIQIIIEL